MKRHRSAGFLWRFEFDAKRSNEKFANLNSGHSTCTSQKEKEKGERRKRKGGEKHL